MTELAHTSTELTVVAGDDHVSLRLHASHVELRLTLHDAERVATSLDSEIRARGHASLITVTLDEQNALEVDMPTAQRLSIELRQAARTARQSRRRRKTPKERAYIDDTIALGRARTSGTAIRIARKMIDDGQDVNDTLTRLWNTAHSRGWQAGIDDISVD